MAARTQVLAFLDEIRENPDDDTPRLVLADWLEEHGDEADLRRAELIRVGCRLRSLAADDSGRTALAKRDTCSSACARMSKWRTT